MSGKQMEGDNQRRRALARQARERGEEPSAAGVTFGGSKQFEHVNRAHRSGPPPAGTAHKPTAEKGGPAPPPPPERSVVPGPAWPRYDPEAVGEERATPVPVKYRELVADVGRRAGVDFEEARSAAVATVTALARALEGADRQRLLDSVAPALHNNEPVVAPLHPRDVAGFLDEVVRMTHRSREQARYQAQATLGALADQDRDLVDSLDLPADIRDLLAPLPAGGGLVDATGRTATLTDDEIRGALADLPYWSGNQRALSRLLVLPPDNLERVLARLELLRQEVGRRPHIGRQSDSQAVIVVRTNAVRGVTATDVDLARAVDAAIEEVGAGMA
jgi:pterin-4a-carbinolamine dehydratase